MGERRNGGEEGWGKGRMGERSDRERGGVGERGDRERGVMGEGIIGGVLGEEWGRGVIGR